jgi:hypothetical protein
MALFTKTVGQWVIQPTGKVVKQPLTFSATTAFRETAPVYFVTIDGVTDREFATMPVKGAVLNKVICMQIPSGTSQTLSPLQGRATVGEVVVRLVDVDGEMTRLISTEQDTPVLPTLINRRITIRAGYRDITESNFQEVFTGEIRDVGYQDLLLYEFKIADFKRRYEERIMEDLDNETTSSFDVAGLIGDNVLTLKAVEGFSPGNSILLFKRDGSQSETHTVQSVDTEALTVTINGTLQSTWDIDDIVTKGVRLKGNIVNVFYSLLTNTFSTNAEDPFPLIDTHGTPTGLSLVDADLNLNLFTRTRDRFLGDFDVDFLFTKPEIARSFFEKDFFPLGFYPTVGGDGKLGIRAFVPPGPEDLAPAKIHEQHMLSFPTWVRKFSTHINKVEVFGDVDDAGRDEVLLKLLEDTTDQTDTGETGSYTLISRGLRSALEGVDIAFEIASRILSRFKVPPIDMNLSVMFSKREIEVGDIVSVSHPSLPDTFTNTLGIVDRLLEVTKAQPDFRGGRMVLSVLETGFVKYAWMGPPTMPDRPAATAADIVYAYMGDSNNKVNAGTEDGYITY